MKLGTMKMAVVAAFGYCSVALAAPPLQEAYVSNGFSVAAVGDLIVTQPIAAQMKRESPDLVKLLHSTDVTFGNFEETAIDMAHFKGHPQALSGGGWLVTPTTVPPNLSELGFNLLSRANNHATDWGVEGMLDTDAVLDKVGIVHAGTGKNLSAARAPRFLGTAAGRVSLIALSSSFTPMEPAIDALDEVPGRPGINALHTTRYVLVPPERLAQLAQIRDMQPAGSVEQSVLEADKKNHTVTLFETKYQANSRPGAGNELAFSFKMNEQDRKEILKEVLQAKQTSDFVIVSNHNHQPGNFDSAPPDFMFQLAHDAIDKGADEFIGHGPHQLRGIEIYKGKPIFYSLGNFFFMDNSQSVVTREEYEKTHTDPTSLTKAEFMEERRVSWIFKEQIWFESVVAISRFDQHGKVKEIQLYPVELGWAGRDASRGIPHLAKGDDARRILSHLKELSEPLGTIIEIDKGIGVIRIPS